MSPRRGEMEAGKSRREEALVVAEACATLLRERFGARRVILFGSLAGQGPWHECSDIDLAVEGLPPADFFPAYSACRDLLPQGMELDLVPLEDAHPQMRARILGEVEMASNAVLALKGLIEDELTTLERIVEHTEEGLAMLSDPPGQFELHGLAAYIHQFYTGVESIFERIVVYLGEEMPRGEYWHVDLLNQMVEEREAIRPPVLDEPLRARLKEYLDFRHFFRHAYGYTPEWVKMRPLAEGMGRTQASLREQLERFFGRLPVEGTVA